MRDFFIFFKSNGSHDGSNNRVVRGRRRARGGEKEKELQTLNHLLRGLHVDVFVFGHGLHQAHIAAESKRPEPTEICKADLR